jgi:uncharacterized protein (DUF2141 family)
MIANFVTISAFSQTSNAKTVVIEVNNVTKNAGTVHISVSLNEEAYKKRTPDRSYQVSPADNVVRKEITLPLGDCVINVYQDCNENGKCDNNFFGIPKEPVGISNWNGGGIPGNFNKHKVNINDKTQKITINLYQL